MSNFFIVVYTLSAVLMLLLFFASIYKSSEEKTTYFSFFILHGFFYSLGVVIEISSLSITQAIIANSLEFFGISFVAPYFLLLICEYTEQPIRNKGLSFSLFIIPIFCFLMQIFDPITGLFYKKFELVPVMEIHYLDVEGTWIRTLLFGYMFFIFALAFIIAIKCYFEGGKYEKKRVRFFITGVFAPLIMLAMYLMDISPYGMDFAPIIIVFVAIYYGYHILIKKIFLTLPYARTNVIEYMRDGYLLIDLNNNYLDSNKMAKKLLPELKNMEVGDSIQNVEGILEDIVTGKADKSFKEFEIKLEDGDIRYYSLSKSVVSENKEGSLISWLMHDVTEQRKMLNDLEYIANHDALTKIYNRKVFFSKCSELFFENVKASRTFAVFILDIDHFKSINDTYGHPAGDKVLVEVVEKIKKKLRKGDIFARYGGEEFVIFVEGVNKKAAFSIGEKLRKSISGDMFNIENEKKNITISIGIGMYDEEKHKCIDDVLATADDLLYKAKNTGRNKAVIG